MEKTPINLRLWLYETIFEAETRAGKYFDIALLWSIIISITAVALESVPDFQILFQNELTTIEWFFTILFTVEYGFRLFVDWLIFCPLLLPT